MSRKYTLEEDAVILDEVLMHRGNPGNALRIASERLGRTYQSVRSRWYNHLSKDTVDTLPELSVSPMRKPKKGLVRKVLEWLGICR